MISEKNNLYSQLDSLQKLFYEQRFEDVIKGIDKILRPYGGRGAFGRNKQSSAAIVEQELNQLRGMATVLPFAFLAVAAFLLNMVLSRLISLQRTEIAVLKALGYSKVQIAQHFLKLVITIALLGTILGLSLGAWLGNELTALYADYFRFPKLRYRLTPSLITWSILVSLLSATIGS